MTPWSLTRMPVVSPRLPDFAIGICKTAYENGRSAEWNSTFITHRVFTGFSTSRTNIPVDSNQSIKYVAIKNKGFNRAYAPIKNTRICGCAIIRDQNQNRLVVCLTFWSIRYPGNSDATFPHNRMPVLATRLRYSIRLICTMPRAS